MDEQQENQPVIPRPMIPVSYFNGFSLNFTPTDAQIALTVNGSPQEIIISSPITMKNMALSMLKMIEDFEAKTGNKVPEFNEIKDKMLANKK